MNNLCSKSKRPAQSALLKNTYNVKALCYSGLQRAWRSVAMWAGKKFFSQRRSHFAESEKLSLNKKEWQIIKTERRIDWVAMGRNYPKAPLFDHRNLSDAEAQAYLRTKDPNAVVKNGIVETFTGKIDYDHLRFKR